MKILIIGAGKVGSALARRLSCEKHDVTIIDSSKEALRRAADTLDVMCVKGTGASPAVLKAAGAASCDMVLSTTNRDEINLLCSLAAKRLGAKYTVARVRDAAFSADIASLQRDLDIDAIINPEYAAALEISKLLRYPGVANIDAFFRGRVELLEFVVQEGDSILGHSLADFSGKTGKLSFLFCGAEREGIFLVPDGSFIPRKGDRLYVAGEPAGIDKFFRILGRHRPKIHSVFIVGGSRIAHYLASMLEHMEMKVTLVEISEACCRTLSERLPNTLILHGDGTDQELLSSEHFMRSDAFIALTGRDEDNLMTSLYARQQGIHTVIAKCSRGNYSGIIRSAGLGSVVSPPIITANRILQVVRGFENKKGSVMTAFYRIADDKAEAAEFTVNSTARHLGVPLKNLPLKKDILIAAILHEGKVVIPGGTGVIFRGDQVIVISRGHGILDFNDIYLT